MRILLRHPRLTKLSIVAAVLLVAVYASVLRLTGAATPALALDRGWQEVLVAVRSPVMTTVARFFDVIGGGWFGSVVVPAVVVVAFLLARRPWSALCVVVAVSASGLVVTAVKALVARERPGDILVDIASYAFPSGHSSHAATLSVVVALLLHRRTAWIAATLYTLLMMASRTYLGAHWLTDTVGGAVSGAAVAVTVVLAVRSGLGRLPRLGVAADIDGVRRH